MSAAWLKDAVFYEVYPQSFYDSDGDAVDINNAADEDAIYTVLSAEEGTRPSFHEKIRIASVREYNYEDVCRDIDELFTIAQRYDDMATVKKMKEIVPEFKSNNSVYEVLDK